MTDHDAVRMHTRAGKGVIAATVLGSGMTFLDSLVVNLALPKMDTDIHLGVSGAQWVVSGYLLTVSAFLLIGGSLGDIYGRRRVYLVGLVGFVVLSVCCGLAPTPAALIAARCLQGIAGALMVPASLAIIQSAFVENDRSEAIGAWTGWSTIFTALGPFVGGAFVTYATWRWAFFINVPIGIASYITSKKFVPEQADKQQRSVDYIGATLCTVALGGLLYWSIEGAGNASSVASFVGVLGLLLLVAFVYWERRAQNPMLDFAIFQSRQFNIINAFTIVFYGAFIGGSTLLGVQLQNGLGYEPLQAAMATLPVSGAMMVLSRRFGALANRLGNKSLMVPGALLVAGALVGMSNIRPGSHYVVSVLPWVVLWGIGLSMVVAPLTSAALAAPDQKFVGMASAINNMASRVGQAFAIALIPALAGIHPGASLKGREFENGYATALHIAAAFCVVSAVFACTLRHSRTSTN